MTAAGSIAGCRLLARNPLKLPGRFQDRDDCPRMAESGWFAEWLVSVQIARRESGIAVFNVAAHSAFNT